MSQKLDFVLLIDDEEATGFLHQIMVEESGVTDRILLVDTAEKGLEKLAQLKSENPEISGLVFLDINMPVMDGWMFLDELRLNVHAYLIEGVCIYMVSASDYPKDFERIEAEPLVKGYVPKPLTSEKVIEVASKC